MPNAECIAKEANLEAIEAQEHALRKYVKTGLKPLALDDVKRYSDAFDSIVQEGMDADNKD